MNNISLISEYGSSFMGRGVSCKLYINEGVTSSHNKLYNYSWFKSLYHSSRIVPSNSLRSLQNIMMQSEQQMLSKIRNTNFVGQQILTRVWFAKFDNSLLFLQAFPCINIYSSDLCCWWEKQISCDCFTIPERQKYASFSRHKNLTLCRVHLRLGCFVCMR